VPRETVNKNRRSDIAAALKRAKPSDMLTLEELALIWGVTKPRFVTVRNTMADFPAPLPGQGNVYIYPARKALEAMLKHETRHDEAASQRRARADAILGRNGKGKASDTLGDHTPNELVLLSRLAADVEERERAMRIHIPAVEVSDTAGDVFGEMSEFLSDFANEIDPNGLLDPDTRERIDKAARERLLHFHRRMKHILTADGDAGGAPSGQTGAGRAPRGAGGARPRRKRQGGLRGQAG
jgi:hypothetical protein